MVETTIWTAETFSFFFGLNKFCVFYYSIFSAMFLDLRFLAMLALHKSWSSFLVISTEIIHLKIGFSIIKTPSILGEKPLFLETLI